jgi:uncharacterized protein (DUF1810 family)
MNTTQKTTPTIHMYYVVTLNTYSRYTMIDVLAKSLEEAEDKVLSLPNMKAVRAFDNYASAKKYMMT